MRASRSQAIDGFAFSRLLLLSAILFLSRGAQSYTVNLTCPLNQTGGSFANEPLNNSVSEWGSDAGAFTSCYSTNITGVSGVSSFSYYLTPISPLTFWVAPNATANIIDAYHCPALPSAS